MIIAYIVNVDWFFISHRLPIALEALTQGHEVHIFAKDTGRMSYLESLGLKVHPINLARGSINPFSSFKLLSDLKNKLKKIKPDVVHLVTIKPVLIGGLASILAKVPSIVYAISGLGFIFTNTMLKAKILRLGIIPLYRLALSAKNKTVIVQNLDDLRILRQYVAIPESQTILIPGSGVDLKQFDFQPLPLKNKIVLMACRLLADKGVYEFHKSAQLLKEKYSDVRFVLVGGIDSDNPASLTEQELNEWVQKGDLEWWGHQSNMPEVLSQATIVVLPSYREGMPKVLLEAQALGRPIVTTDVPGCREAIENGKTGFLAQVKDEHSLANAIEKMIINDELCLEFSRNARALAEHKFDIKQVVKTHMNIYENLVQSQHAN
ncbi:glycosyltransferase family 4 protein [Acinetobacter radioresistens]|uniref:glycosyltransferase family 4 protein n=1 Tax=Acinetobacter radioresistens TaxID=40216 RepID=UPI0021CD39C6|nr:glycosyltransferase family 4 protein [Acinetobacter radioresistens]MCU4499507.1 glycosyltransferase family 4 protein [Acinetobacter radioresistens]